MNKSTAQTDPVHFSPLTGNVVKRAEKHISVEEYNAVYTAIEKESYTEGDYEVDKSCEQVTKTRIEDLEDEISKLQREQEKRQKETDALILELSQYVERHRNANSTSVAYLEAAELRQYVERYRNANNMALAAQQQFADLVRDGVLKRTETGYEPVLTCEHIDETVFMCKIRANKMAEAFHRYMYQKNNAYANTQNRHDAEVAYLEAVELFNSSFTAM